MRLVYHPAVQKDVNGILNYYEGIAGELADEFWNELCRTFGLIATNPQQAQAGLVRVNLRRFPYHVLYRRLPVTIRIIVVRHDKRHPKMGTSRR